MKRILVYRKNIPQNHKGCCLFWRVKKQYTSVFLIRVFYNLDRNNLMMIAFFSNDIVSTQSRSVWVTAVLNIFRHFGKYPNIGNDLITITREILKIQ